MGKRLAAKITGVAGYVPPRLLTNADLERMVDTTDEWIQQRVGIRERHVVDKGVATSHLATAAAQKLLEKIRHDPVEWMQTVNLPSVGINRAQLTSLLHALFESCGSPIKLDDLVNVVADICREKDQPDESLEIVTNLAGPTLDFETILEQQHMLALLWREVCQLPRRQRVALLLNFKDARGQELVSLLPYTRTATIAQIAEATDFPIGEFLSLWNKLPLDDVTIAELLGATRQQVINLRKCARERLERRMSAVLAKSSAAGNIGRL